jgi:hypothetical protein
VSASNYPVLSTGLGLFLIIVLCYTAGRMHQWYRTSTDRESAFREGYDTATKSLFSLATRTMKAMARQPARGAAPVSPATRGTPPVTQVSPVTPIERARHRADDSMQRKFHPSEFKRRESA